jgi:hypothetical protein
MGRICNMHGEMINAIKMYSEYLNIRVHLGDIGLHERII